MYRIKQTLRDKLSDQVYNGFWFSPEGQFTRRCLDIAAESVEGTVKLEVFKGQGKTSVYRVAEKFILILVIILGRASKTSLYNADLVSMDKHIGFSPQDATGFINIQAIRLKEYQRSIAKD